MENRNQLKSGVILSYINLAIGTIIPLFHPDTLSLKFIVLTLESKYFSLSSIYCLKAFSLGTPWQATSTVISWL